MKAKIIIFVKVLFSILLLISCENKSIVHIPEHTHPLIPVELSLQEQQ